MKNPNVQAWVAALRSGKYKQGQQRLRTDDNRFCCLGVACELAVQAGIITYKRDDQLGPTYVETGWKDTALLPEVVRRWLGLTTNRGDMSEGPCLTHLNDHDATFNEIADLIESQPKGLFEGL